MRFMNFWSWIFHIICEGRSLECFGFGNVTESRNQKISHFAVVKHQIASKIFGKIILTTLLIPKVSTSCPRMTEYCRYEYYVCTTTGNKTLTSLPNTDLMKRFFSSVLNRLNPLYIVIIYNWAHQHGLI